jgi:hypothetical protein
MLDPEDDLRADYEDIGRPLTETTTLNVREMKRMPRRLRNAIQIGAVCLLSGACLCAVLVVVRAREAANRMKGSGQLSQIGLAIHNYNDTNGELPKNTYSPEGKPLLSWRVHILPFIEEDRLYQRFNLDEPWDSPNNIRLLGQMPRIFGRPGDAHGQSSLTYYRGFRSSGAAFERRLGDHLLVPDGSYKPFSIADFKDGTSNTILVVEAGDPVEWTKPDDLDDSPGKPFPKMGGMGWRNVFQVLLADGSVRSFKLDTRDHVLREWISCGGGEVPRPE